MGAPVMVSQGVEGWRRRIDRRLRLLPYAALAGSTALVLVVGDRLAHAPLPVELGLVAVTALWQVCMVTLRHDFDANMRLQVIFFLGLLALCAALVWTNSLFGFFAWSGYLYISGFRGRWQLAGAAGVAVMTATSQVGGFQVLTTATMWRVYAIVLAFNIVIASAMTKLASVINAQSARRQEMIEELAHTNAKLEAALPEALADVVTGWAEITGVAAELITTGTARPLLPEIEATLLRTAQEALANVGKHANASRVALTLSYMEDLVTLDVRDDGAGFDPAAPLAESYDGGYGLAAMRERLLRIAGALEVESEPGAGTAISAFAPAIPVRAAA
jgi:hypothetical protein